MNETTVKALSRRTSSTLEGPRVQVKNESRRVFADTSECPNNSKKDGAMAEGAVPGSSVIIRGRQHELLPLKNDAMHYNIKFNVLKVS